MNSSFFLFSEPNFPYLQALRPFQPLAMKSYYCPIDTSLNFSQANKLIKEMKPSLLVLPESYTKAHNPSTNHFIEHQVILYNENDVNVISFFVVVLSEELILFWFL